MKSLVAITTTVTFTMAVAVAVATAGDAAHDRQLSRVATYHAAEGFDHVVAGKRFSGFFLPARGGCSVSLVVTEADDEGLHTPPQRIRVELGAAQVFDIAASRDEALGIACTVDADAVKVTALRRTDTHTAQRD